MLLPCPARPPKHDWSGDEDRRVGAHEDANENRECKIVQHRTAQKVKSEGGKHCGAAGQIVRPSVSLIARFIMNCSEPAFVARIPSRIRSKTTIVSLIEYPAIVSTAPTIIRDNSRPNKANAPIVKITSCNNAMIAPRANANSNRAVT